MKGGEKLRELWRKIEARSASEQDRIQAAALAGEAKDPVYRTRLRDLAGDAAPQVRYYALQALVIDLGFKGPAELDLCWRSLATDPDEDVRAMAAACIGSSLFGTKSSAAFTMLKEVLADPGETSYVKDAAYSALHKLAGVSPKDWPGLLEPWDLSSAPAIDWEKVSELEDECLNS